jgi:hypothetical protein
MSRHWRAVPEQRAFAPRVSAGARRERRRSGRTPEKVEGMRKRLTRMLLLAAASAVGRMMQKKIQARSQRAEEERRMERLPAT